MFREREDHAREPAIARATTVYPNNSLLDAATCILERIAQEKGSTSAAGFLLVERREQRGCQFTQTFATQHSKE